MKKAKFTEERNAFALKQVETDTAVEEICRKMGISQARSPRGARSSVGSALPKCAGYASLRKRTASSSSGWPIRTWTRSCCGTCWQKSSEAHAAQDARGPSLGKPRLCVSRSSTRLTPWPEIARSTSMATASCIASSTITRHLITRPSAVRSDTKSIDQT